MMINQTSAPHPNCVVATKYKNSSPKQFYSRLSFGESFKTRELYIQVEEKLIRPELETNIKDARVIWVNSGIFKIDFCLALVKYNELIYKRTTELQSNGFSLNPDFNEVFYELNNGGFIDKFNSLTETEQEYLSLAMLHENYPKTIDILCSYDYLHFTPDLVVDL